MPLSEALAARRTARPRWRRAADAVAARLPETLHGRWTVTARAVVALACLAALGAGLGGWYLTRSQGTVVELPGPAAGVAAADSVAVAGTGTTAAPEKQQDPADGAVGGLKSSGSLPPPTAKPNAAHRAGPCPSPPTNDHPPPACHGAPCPDPAVTDRPPLACAAAPNVVVDIEGKVAHPGIQALPAGSRVFEALQAAGGALPGADATALDLARPLADGEQLRVGISGAPSPPAGLAPPPGGAGHGKRAKPAQPVELNAATLEQLESVPAIGPAMAQRILDWRSQHGRFSSVAQLRQVKGIGERKFAQMRDSVSVTVGGGAAP